MTRCALFLAASLVTFVAAFGGDADPVGVEPAATTPNAPATVEVRWFTNFDEAKAEAKKLQRPILLYCPAEDSTARDVVTNKLLPEVAALLSQTFVGLRVDAGTNLELTKIYRVGNETQFVVLDEEGRQIGGLLDENPPNPANRSEPPLKTGIESAARRYALWSEYGLALVHHPLGGTEVRDVRPESLAAKNGVRAGDVLFSLNGYKIQTSKDAAYAIQRAKEEKATPLEFSIGRDLLPYVGRMNPEGTGRLEVMTEAQELKQPPEDVSGGSGKASLSAAIKDSTEASQVWLTDFAEAEAEAARTKRPIVAFFYADWCSYCQAIRPVLRERTVLDAIQKHVVAVQVNTDTQSSVATRYGVNGLPTLITLNSAGRPVPNGTVTGSEVGELLKERIADAPRLADGGVWFTNLALAKAEARKSNRPIAAFFHAASDGPSKTMRRILTQEPAVLDDLRRYVVAVEIDVAEQSALAEEYTRGVEPQLLLLTADGQPVKGEAIVGTASPERVRTWLANASAATDFISSLGAELRPIDAGDKRLANTPYRGGLEVTEVDPKGPGAKAGIQVSDVLVGLGTYETVKLGDVEYTLRRATEEKSKSLNFFVLRNGQSFSGHLGFENSTKPTIAGVDGDHPQLQMTRPEFTAALWLVKADWSQMADQQKKVKVTEELMATLKDAAVPAAVLERLPGSGPEALFPPEVELQYSRESAAGLLAWLKSNDLLVETIDFPTPAEIPPSEADAASAALGMPATNAHFLTTLQRPYDFLDLPAPRETESSTSFVNRETQWSWSLWQNRPGAVEGLRKLTVWEKLRGQKAQTAVSGLDQFQFWVQSTGDRVTIMDAFPASSDREFREGAVRKGYHVLLVISSARASTNDTQESAAPRLSLPDVVGRLMNQHSNRMSFPGGRRGGFGGMRGSGANPFSGMGSSSMAMQNMNGSRGTPRSSPAAAPATPAGELKVIRLENAEAVQVTSLLAQVLGTNMAKIIPDPRTNSLIVEADDSTTLKIEALVQVLDQPSEKPNARADDPDAADPLADDVSPILSKIPHLNRLFKYPGNIDELRREYESKDRAAAEIAKQIQGRQADESRRSRDRERLTQAVREAFAARQKLLRAELVALQVRISNSRESLELRDKAAEQIVERRVEDLLNPEFRWEEPKSSEGTAAGPLTQVLPPSRAGHPASGPGDGRSGTEQNISPFGAMASGKRRSGGFPGMPMRPELPAGMWKVETITGPQDRPGESWASGGEFALLEERVAFLKDGKIAQRFQLRGVTVSGRSMQFDILSVDKQISLMGRFDGETIVFEEAANPLAKYIRCVRTAEKLPEEIMVELFTDPATPARSQIPAGKTVVTINVDASRTASNMLKANDFVDVLVTYDRRTPSGIETQSMTLLERVQLFSDPGSIRGPNRTNLTQQKVSLVVDYEEANAVVLAERKGQLRLLWRDPQDETLRVTPQEREQVINELGGLNHQAAPDASQSGTAADQVYKQRIAELVSEREKILAEVGPNHPSTKKLDQQIEALEAMKSADPGSPGVAASGGRRMPFDYLQAMRSLGGESHAKEREALKAEYDAQLAGLESDQKAAEAEVAIAKREVERSDALHQRSAISQAEVDAARDRLTKAQAALEKAQSQTKLFRDSRDTIFTTAADSKAQLKVYSFPHGDPREVTKTLSAILPGLFIKEGPSGKTIHAMGTDAQQMEIEAVFQQLEALGRESDAQTKPTIDPRFVGEWTWHKVQGSYPENISHPSRAIATLSLNANGSGMSQGIFPKTTSQRPIRWWNDQSGRLVIKSDGFFKSDAEEFLANLRARATGGAVISTTTEYAIREASAERFVVDRPSSPSLYFILKRASPADPARKD